jgi:hypothetical protein
MDDERPRIAILLAGMSGYAHACFSALSRRGVEVRVFHSAGADDAPYDPQAITTGLSATAWRASRTRGLRRIVERSTPTRCWCRRGTSGPYRQLARRWLGRTLRVLCMDNQWWATPKQRLGVPDLAVRPCGPRSTPPSCPASARPTSPGASLRRRPHHPGHLLVRPPPLRRGGRGPGRGRAAAGFLYLGRLVTEKGIDYPGRRLPALPGHRPRPVAAAGGWDRPAASRLSGLDGVDMLGFVQPDDLPGLLARAGCLVLPSRFEPWGVVVHEAAAAGLPVVASSASGAASRLVVDGYNGVIVPPGAPDCAGPSAGAHQRIQ